MQNSVKTLTIQEVSERSGISKHTLRFWEKELDGVIVPLRTKGGQRRYTLKHLFLIEEIKRLKNERKSLAEIRVRLNNRHILQGNNSNNHKIDLLADRVVEVVRSAIYNFFETEPLD